MISIYSYKITIKYVYKIIITKRYFKKNKNYVNILHLKYYILMRNYIQMTIAC